MKPLFLFSGSLALMAVVGTFSVAVLAEELPSCFSPPVREDNSWQNWYADNKCNFSVTIHYETKGKTASRRDTAFAEACKRTRIIQTFKEEDIGGFSYEWKTRTNGSCGGNPQPGSTESKPRDLSKQLQSASTDAQDAAAKNQQDLSRLNKQHQQAADSEIARYKAGVRNWCASQAQNCDAKCVSKSRGSENYMSACVNLCRTLVDACASDDGSQSAQAEARVRAANDNMKQVVDQLNRQLGEQRAREEMEAALQVQAFVSALSGMAKAYQSTSGGNSGGGGASGRAPRGGGRACTYAQGCEASR
jgi:hypothetical protein